MVTEDERIIAMDIQHSLEDFGYEVTAMASTGEDAIGLAEETTPALILMDIVLRGEMSGIEAADAIYTRFNIPVIYLSAYVDDVKLERAKLTRPFGYLVKPFKEKELKTAIETALYRHQLE